jgi:hypothetical protein
MLRASSIPAAKRRRARQFRALAIFLLFNGGLFIAALALFDAVAVPPP